MRRTITTLTATAFTAVSLLAAGDAGLTGALLAAWVAIALQRRASRR